MKGLDSLVSLTSTLIKTLSDNSKKQIEVMKDLFFQEGQGEKNQTAKIIAGVHSVVGASSLKKLTKEQTENVITLIEGVSKIVKSISYEESVKFSDALKNTADGISSLLNLLSIKNYIKLKLAGVFLHKGLKSLINSIQEIYSDVSDPENLKQQGIAIKSLALGISSITKAVKGLAVISLLSPFALVGGLVVRGIVGMFQIASKHYKDLEQGGKGMEAIGRGLLSVSIGLGAFVLLGKIAGYDTLIKGTLMLGLLSGVFISIGLGGKFIERGAIGIREMGKSLILFTAGLASIALFMHITGGEVGMVSIISMLAGFSLAFATIGFAEKFIRRGSTAIAEMSISMAIFGLATWAFSELVKKVGVENILIGSVLLGIMGGSFSLLGIMQGPISKGSAVTITMALGLAALGIGLVLFSYSIEKLKSVFSTDPLGTTALIVGVIVGMGAAFSLLGTLSPILIPGALAASSIGLALASIGLGVLAFSGSMFLTEKMGMIDKQGNLKGIGVIKGVLGMFSSLFFESIFAIPGIAVGIAMGAALLSISVGLIAFGSVSKFLDSMGAMEKTKDGSYRLKATSLIRDLVSMFSSVFFESITAVPGIAVVTGMGISLLSIAWGLNNVSEVFAKLPMQNGVPLITDQLNKVITSLFSTFKNISDITAGSNISSFPGGSFIKNLVGTDPITMGIKVVSGIGNALLSIAEGIGAFSDLHELKTPSGKTISLVEASSNISASVKMIWDSMSGAIIEIGNTAGGSGFLGSLKNLLGNDPISTGLRILKQLGTTLKSVVGGISSFANFEEFPVEKVENGKIVIGTANLWKIAESFKTNLPTLFNSLAEGFKAVNLDDFEDDEKLKLLGLVGTSFGQLFTSVAKINDITIDPKKIDSLRNLGTIVKQLSSVGKNFASFANPFALFTRSLDSFNHGLEKYASLINVNKAFSAEFVSLSTHGKGMIDFSRGFQIMSVKMHDFAVNFKKMDKETIGAFKVFNESLKVFSTLDSKKLAPFLEQVKEFYEPVKENISASRVQPVNNNSNQSPFFQQPVVNVSPNIDMTSMISAINELKQEVILLNTKFRTGKGGGLLVSEL